MAGANCKASGQRAVFDEGMRENRRNCRFSDSRFAGARPPIKGESYRNSAWREYAHHTKRSDTSSSIPAKVDNQPVDFSQLFGCTRDFVCHLDPDHAGEHRNFQIAQIASELAALNKRRLDKM
jgi:hypothetical protein